LSGQPRSRCGISERCRISSSSCGAGRSDSSAMRLTRISSAAAIIRIPLAFTWSHWGRMGGRDLQAGTWPGEALATEKHSHVARVQVLHLYQAISIRANLSRMNWNSVIGRTQSKPSVAYCAKSLSSASRSTLTYLLDRPRPPGQPSCRGRTSGACVAQSVPRGSCPRWRPSGCGCPARLV
jgi:hypothetical protein